MGIRLQRTVRHNLRRLSDPAAHSEGVVSLVPRSDQGGAGSPAMTDAFEHDRVGHVVLADVGGTNVRFALLMGGVLDPIEHLAVRDPKDFSDALDAFMSRQSERAAIRSAVLAVAGGGKGERCALPNNAW